MGESGNNLSLIYYPDPRLRRPCEPIQRFDGRLRALARRMFEVMYAAKGVGLAAPQVGVCQRLFICNASGEPGDEQVFVNPSILDLLGAIEAEEGCLSVPEVIVPIRRARVCQISAFDLEGRPFQLRGEDLVARVWQHEMDHLDGRLILDRMSPASRLANRRAIKKLEEDFKKASSVAR